ncbi:MAG: PDDEXK nuclease domain-containing protein [Bacteroidales bacterium]|nr:PDDEXK nuclease domain-containing protein [Bacteroidales bacterium]
MAEDIIQPLETQFSELLTIIQGHRSAASRAVNTEQLQMAWEVGAYVSSKLKTEQWGSKVVTQFVEYAHKLMPDLYGFSRRSIYNMVMFFEEYSSKTFSDVLNRYMPSSIVQAPAQLSLSQPSSPSSIVQAPTQLQTLLNQTTFSKHVVILNQCKVPEERLFYILYTHKERLSFRELQRCISTDTFTNLLGSKDNLSKGLKEMYPSSPVLFKDTTYLDFLGLPKNHNEMALREGISSHMKEFILELGKDFIFMGEEYPLEVGGETFHVDLLFFHRGIQALCAVELKKTPFHPKDMGQLNFYLEALDRDVKRSNENPSVGILLCPSANKTVVEYAMSRNMSPTLVAEYKRQLIPKEKMQILLDEYCEYLNEELK